MLGTRRRARERIVEDLASVRQRTLALVEHLDRRDLERALDPLMSPLVWDLAHIAAYEDLWICGRHGGRELLRPDLAAMYDAFETPRAVRADMALLDTPHALAYLADVRERSLAVLDEHGAGDGTYVELVLRHELQHTETMRQAMALGGLLPPGDPPPAPAPGAGGYVALEAATFAMGAGPDGFAYDNERPRHPVALRAFEIARTPVTNAMWLQFAGTGAREDRAWWSEAGWTWRQDEGRADVSTARTGDPGAPVCHVSFFEAEAFARFAGARLPSEAEWERAATAGVLAGTGYVWEWTTSTFAGYPGFVAHPYPEYSEVFFGDRYRVLRGGSWASHARVATPTFRNWDLPQRRQIFAGVRLARDVEAAA